MMSENKQSELMLGPPPGEMVKRMGQGTSRWRWLGLLWQVAVLACLILLVFRSADRGAAGGSGGSVDMASELREVASRLEERSLAAEAAAKWSEYLQVEPGVSDRAEILYRIGKLHMEAEQFGDAASALVRAEIAAGSDANLEAKIGQRLVECLQRLGRYGEVDRELSRQVEAGADTEETGRGKVLATMAGEDLTEADLDRMIERVVDGTMAAQGIASDSATREAMLKQFSNPQMRQQMLQQLLQTELFCRRAREPDMRLDQESTFRLAREQFEESFLASRFLANQLEKVQPTAVDIDAYHQANKNRYEEQEFLEVQWLKLTSDENVDELLKSIDSAEKFRDQVKQRRGQDGNLPPARRITRGRPDGMLTDVEPLFKLDADQWTKAVLEGKDGKYLVLVEKKTAARVPPLEEINSRVQSDYTNIKQRELTEKLFRDLMLRYKVKLAPQKTPSIEAAEDAEPAKEDKGQEESP